MVWSAKSGCPRCPMMLSSSLAIVLPVSSVKLIIFVNATNLFVGRDTMSHLVSSFHPRMIFSSSSPALEDSLLRAFISSCGIGLWGCLGQEQQSIASGVARLHQNELLVSSRWTVAWMKLSMCVCVCVCVNLVTSTLGLSHDRPIKAQGRAPSVLRRCS